MFDERGVRGYGFGGVRPIDCMVWRCYARDEGNGPWLSGTLRLPSRDSLVNDQRKGVDCVVGREAGWLRYGFSKYTEVIGGGGHSPPTHTFYSIARKRGRCGVVCNYIYKQRTCPLMSLPLR